MKNWITEHTKDVKEWFSVENYHFFKGLTLKAYYHELWARAIWHRPWPTEEEGNQRTWTGQGRTPKAILNAIESGKELKDFEI